MSKYTTEVRYICEVAAGLDESVGFKGIDDVLDEAVAKVFDFSFPIFDEAYRVTLEKKILRHYYTREICEETVGLWKLRLYDKMNMIMPYYNQLYTSELLKFNPLYDVDLTRTNTGVRNNEQNNDTESNTIIASKNIDKRESERQNTGITVGTNESDTIGHQEGTSESWDKYSETPQGSVTGLANDEYLTNARNINDKNQNSAINNEKVNSNQSTNIFDKSKQDNVNSGNRVDNAKSKGRNVFSGTENYIERVAGKQGATSYSKLLEEFRRTFLNIDAMVIEELSDLFFGLW